MTRIASRPLRQTDWSSARRMRGAWISAVAAASLFGAASPGNAACSGPDLSVADTASLGGSTWQVPYICKNNCAVQSASAPVIDEIWLYDIREWIHCRSRCSARRDCYAVAWRDTLVLHEGRFVRARICVLYGRTGSLTTTDHRESNPMNYSVVCQRVAGDNKVWGQDGLDRPGVQQDQHRPGVPGPSVPTKP